MESRCFRVTGEQALFTERILGILVMGSTGARPQEVHGVSVGRGTGWGAMLGQMDHGNFMLYHFRKQLSSHDCINERLREGLQGAC